MIAVPSFPASPPRPALQLVPKSDLGAALAVTDVLGSVVGVAAPILGGAVIQCVRQGNCPLEAHTPHTLEFDSVRWTRDRETTAALDAPLQ